MENFSIMSKEASNSLEVTHVKETGDAYIWNGFDQSMIRVTNDTKAPNIFRWRSLQLEKYILLSIFAYMIWILQEEIRLS